MKALNDRKQRRARHQVPSQSRLEEQQISFDAQLKTFSQTPTATQNEGSNNCNLYQPPPIHSTPKLPLIARQTIQKHGMNEFH